MNDLPPDLPSLPDAVALDAWPDRVRSTRAWALSIALHALVIGSLVWLDRCSDRIPPARVTQIALVHTAGARAPAAVPVPQRAQPSSRTPPPTAAQAAPAAPAAHAAPATPPAPPPGIADAPRPVPPPVALDLAFIDQARANYRDDLRDYIAARLWYSDDARSAAAGTFPVVLDFTIDRDGKLLASRVATSSGNAAIDDSALQSLRRAAPLPPVPDALPWAQVELDMRLDFTVPPAP